MIGLGPAPIMLQAELGEVVRLRNEGHGIVSPNTPPVLDFAPSGHYTGSQPREEISMRHRVLERTDEDDDAGKETP